MTSAARQQRVSNTANLSSLVARLRQHARTAPGRDTIVTTALTLSYADFEQRVSACAAQLADEGITSESVVGIQCSDDWQHLLFTLAVIEIGATSFALSTREPQNGQQSLADRCGATHIVANGQPRTVSADGLVNQHCASEACLLFSTSGTTGEPKLVVHHDSDMVAQAHRHIGSQQERFACLASMEHNFARRHRLYCLAEGATNVFVDSQRETLVSQIRSLDANVLHVSAFQAQELLALPDIGDLSGIRLKLGGSHVPQELRQQLKSRITTELQAGYGTTETGAIAFTDPADRESAESVGRPLPGIEVRAVSPDREPVGIDERGELAIRCDGMFRGYLDQPEATAARLSDGWFFTGDIGYLDSERRIHLAGRADDMFMFNSMNIYPQEIESRIAEFPGVTEALVVPRSSAVHGCIPVAFVVFEEDVRPDIAALSTFVQDRVGVRNPREYTVVEALPRNDSGKISRRQARDLPDLRAQIRRAVVAALRSGSGHRLRSSAIAAFERGDTDIALHGAGLDSLLRMEILVNLEVEFGVVVTPETFAEFDTLGDICRWTLTAPLADELQSEQRSFPVQTPSTEPRSEAQQHTLRFFRRICRSCPTVAQLNRALGTLEHRITPLEYAFLRELQAHNQLISTEVAGKFHTALSAWFEKMDRLLQDSGKRDPEPFVARRIAPAVTHFTGRGPRDGKTLLICFAPKGGRHLMMPNAVLMQHTDSTRYDLLVVAEPLRQSYRLGIPLLGNSIDTVVEWIRQLDLVNDYGAVRTIGASAGAYMAVVAGFALGAELAVSVAGRFHAERYPLRIFGRLFATWRAVQKGTCSRVLMSYPADKGKTRDRIYARIIGFLTGGSLLGVEFSDGVVGHRVLERLVARSALAPYLAVTAFAETDTDVVANQRTNTVLCLPAGELRPLD